MVKSYIEHIKNRYDTVYSVQVGLRLMYVTQYDVGGFRWTDYKFGRTVDNGPFISEQDAINDLNAYIVRSGEEANSA